MQKDLVYRCILISYSNCKQMHSSCHKTKLHYNMETINLVVANTLHSYTTLHNGCVYNLLSDWNAEFQWTLTLLVKFWGNGSVERFLSCPVMTRSHHMSVSTVSCKQGCNQDVKQHIRGKGEIGKESLTWMQLLPLIQNVHLSVNVHKYFFQELINTFKL